MNELIEVEIGFSGFFRLMFPCMQEISASTSDYPIEVRNNWQEYDEKRLEDENGTYGELD